MLNISPLSTEMSNVVVYVFLLDHLTGFSESLNETVLKNTPATHATLPRITRLCDPHTTDQILNAVSRELDLDVMPMFTNGDNTASIAEDSQESLYNTFIEETVPETEENQEFFEKVTDKYDHVYLRRTLDSKENLTQSKEVAEVPNLAPFLVAIFETKSNITAQTCAGTLLSPHWILTAANCINILDKLYADTNLTHTKTLYTIVAGAKDPLTDGSTHNVTTILEPHTMPIVFNTSKQRRSIETHSPYLAMMKIEPGFEGPSLSLVEEKVKKGDVMIYGWILTKLDTGLDSLILVNISAVILSEAECQARYNLYNNDVICLFNNDKLQNITQLSSGGPVLMLQGEEVKTLAVAQTDDYVLLAYPLHDHIDWIKNVLET